MFKEARGIVPEGKVANSHRVVFVHGFFGWGPGELEAMPYWSEASNADPHCDDPNRRALFASLGPFSSHHDRACELFYQLMGGRCDFGAEHSAKYGHDRYGKNYVEPLYAEWSAENPVHFIAHSQGVPTVRMLQHLLKKRAFTNPRTGMPYETDANWISSLSSVAGANNGTTALYYAGCSRETGRVDADGLSLIQNFLKTVLTNRLAHSKQARNIYDFDLQHWGLEARKNEGAPAFLSRLNEAEYFMESEDNAFFDLTLHGMLKWNQVLTEHPETWYFSYPANRSRRLWLTERHVPYLDTKPHLQYYGWKIGGHSFGDPFPEPIRDYKESDWRANDGALPTWAQEFPRIPSPHPHKHLPAQTRDFERGLWNVMEHDLSGVDHFNITEAHGKSPKKKLRLRRFYETLFERVYSL